MAAYEAQIAAMLRSILNLGHIWRTSQEDEREFFKSLQKIVGDEHSGIPFGVICGSS